MLVENVGVSAIHINHDLSLSITSESVGGVEDTFIVNTILCSLLTSLPFIAKPT